MISSKATKRFLLPFAFVGVAVGLWWFALNRDDRRQPISAADGSQDARPSPPRRSNEAVVPMSRRLVDAPGSPGAVAEDSDRLGITSEQKSILCAKLHDYLSSTIEGSQLRLSQLRPPDNLSDLLAEQQLRVDIRRAQLLLPKSDAGQVEYVIGDRGPPASVLGRLYVMNGSITLSDGRPAAVVASVGPGEDPQLDALARAGNDTARGVAEELAGAFNNLEIDERIHRTQRILELRKSEQTGGGDRAAMRRELDELGDHRFLELDSQQCVMRVASWLRDARWGG